MKSSHAENFIDEFIIENNYRYERKFTIPDDYSVQEIEHQIKSNSWLFKEVFHERRVNNIYFDTYDYENYLDNVLGIFERKKIRVRWYGETFGKIENPILEIKTKKGLIGDKWSYKVDSFDVNNKFTREYIHAILGNSKIPTSILESLKIGTPTLLNSYLRKYYISADKRFRLTLDFHLEYYNMEGRFNNFKKIPRRDPNKIIELKYASPDDKDVAKLTSQFSFRLNKNSKYVNGIDAHKHLPR